MLNISKIEKDQSNLNVKWSDGEISSFNFLWLRDNCPTAHDKDSNHRMFNILDVSINLNVEDFKINNKSCNRIGINSGKRWIERIKNGHFMAFADCFQFYNPKILKFIESKI